jgi:hypothetical protein
MSRYAQALALATSYVNSPAAAAERFGDSADAGSIRRYVELHVQQKLGEIAYAYAAMTPAATSDADYREWLANAQADMAALTDSLRPLRLRRLVRPAALVTIAASVAGVLSKVDLHVSDTGVVVALGLGGMLAFVAALTLGIYVWYLFPSFRQKRELFAEGGVYANEDALFAAIGVAKRREPLTDIHVAMSLITILALYAGGVLAMFGVDAIVAIGAPEGAWLIGIIAASLAQGRAEKSRTPR